MNPKIDELNWKILRQLQNNARESFANIGRIVGLTAPAVAERVKKMEDLGIILGYKASVSHALTGHLEKFIDQLIQYGETRTHIVLSQVISNAPMHKIK